MTVLLEGMSLVFKNSVLDERIAGGTKGFRLAWDNGSFCTDGTISRLSFFESDDGFCTLMAMPALGLDVCTEFATDVGVFLHGCRLWVPCLWLETSAESQEKWCCWHVSEKKESRMAVSSYFRPENTLAHYSNLDEDEIGKRVKRDGEENGVSLFRDQLTERVFGGPSPLRRH